jgi:thiol-disulfide isomerase/thioredoxin
MLNRHLLSLLILLLATACAEETRYKIMENGAVKEYPSTEMAERIRAGEFGDTTMIFDGREWVTFANYAATAELLAARPKPAPTAPATSTAPSALAAPATPAIAPYLTINAGNPGEPIDIAAHLVPGRTVIFDFFSDYCPPCVAIAPQLEKLATIRPEYVIRKIDINRPGRRGIDWGSPVARQYNLDGIPHFKIYDPQGRLSADGEEASRIIRNLLSKI